MGSDVCMRKQIFLVSGEVQQIGMVYAVARFFRSVCSSFDDVDRSSFPGPVDDAVKHDIYMVKHVIKHQMPVSSLTLDRICDNQPPPRGEGSDEEKEIVPFLSSDAVD